MTTGANCQAAMCAYTEERQILFRIVANVSALSKENIWEVKRRIERLPKDSAVFSGIEIRQSLTAEQKCEVRERIAEVTRNDFEYCVEHDVVLLSKHITEDYLVAAPEVLEKRGWASDVHTLFGQVLQTILNTRDVQKGMIHFTQRGADREPLSYTIEGDDGGKKRKLSIALYETPFADREFLLAVTVLRS